MVVELVVLPPEPEDVFSAVRHTSFCEMVLTLSPATSVKKSPAYISMRGNIVEGGSALAIGEKKVISTDQNIFLDLRLSI